MKTPALLLIAFGLLSAKHACATTIDELYGTWRLTSYTRQIVATGEKEDLFGKAPHGFLTYSRDGRMYAIITKDGRPKPKDLSALTDKDRAELYATMVAYSGTFSFDGETVVHHVEISSNEQWTGSDQVRHIKLEGKVLHIRTNPQPHSVDGKLAISILTWEKIENGPRR